MPSLAHTAACLSIFAACCAWLPRIDAVKMELQLQRFEQTNGTHLIDASRIRVKKYNRTLAVYDGAFYFLRDINDPYEFRMTAAYSSLGNNQFNESPMKIPQARICTIMKDHYRDYQQLWVNNTNLPQVTEDGLCPFPKGDYWVRNFAPDASWIPSTAPDGYWRLTLDILDGEDVVEVRLLFFMRIKRAFY